jgi:hypothetical protein
MNSRCARPPADFLAVAFFLVAAAAVLPVEARPLFAVDWRFCAIEPGVAQTRQWE